MKLGSPTVALKSLISNLLAVAFLAVSPTPAAPVWSFAEPVLFPAGEKPARMVAADVDGDGQVDLVLSSGIPVQIVVLRNLSPGGPAGGLAFAPPVRIGGGGPLTVGDVNGDGKPDLLLARKDGVSVLENRSEAGSVTTNSFGPPVFFKDGNTAPRSVPAEVQLADFDRDGHADLLLVNDWIVVFRNTGPGGTMSADSFAAPLVLDKLSATIKRAYPGDLNGDGWPDVRDGNHPQVFLNRRAAGSLAFDKVASGPFGAAGHTDLDGDGRPDLVVGYSVDLPLSGGEPAVTRFLGARLNLSQGGVVAFGPAARLDFPAWCDLPIAPKRDMDGDGQPDWVLGLNRTNQIGLIRNPFFPGAVWPAKLEPAAVVRLPWNGARSSESNATADFDGDGRTDLAWCSAGTGTNLVAIYRNETVPVPLAAPRLNLFPVGLGEAPTLEWSAEPGGQYLVQWSEALRDWQFVTPPITADSWAAEWTDPKRATDPSSPPRRFYRVLRVD